MFSNLLLSIIYEVYMRQLKIHAFIFLPFMLAFVSQYKLLVVARNKIRKLSRKNLIPCITPASTSEQANAGGNPENNTNTWISTFAELSPYMIRGTTFGNSIQFWFWATIVLGQSIRNLFTEFMPYLPVCNYVKIWIPTHISGKNDVFQGEIDSKRKTCAMRYLPCRMLDCCYL